MRYLFMALLLACGGQPPKDHLNLAPLKQDFTFVLPDCRCVSDADCGDGFYCSGGSTQSNFECFTSITVGTCKPICDANGVCIK